MRAHSDFKPYFFNLYDKSPGKHLENSGRVYSTYSFVVYAVHTKLVKFCPCVPARPETQKKTKVPRPDVEPARF